MYFTWYTDIKTILPEPLILYCILNNEKKSMKKEKHTKNIGYLKRKQRTKILELHL